MTKQAPAVLVLSQMCDHWQNQVVYQGLSYYGTQRKLDAARAVRDFFSFTELELIGKLARADYRKNNFAGWIGQEVCPE